jgi:hypothetical protein
MSPLLPTNGLTCLPKHGGAQDNKFLVTHPMTDQRCLTSAIARRSALTAQPSSSSKNHTICLSNVDGPSRDRPRKRWMDCVKDDIKRVSMGMTGDRREWKKETCCADPT